MDSLTKTLSKKTEHDGQLRVKGGLNVNIDVNRKCKYVIVGQSVPNFPWENKPVNCREEVWRYSNNPIIPRDAIPCSNSIFNSGVVPFKGQFAGVFRCDSRSRRLRMHTGLSKDGINWNIEHDPIQLICSDPEISKWVSHYDPRVCQIEDRYYITFANDYHGPTVGIACTDDFKEYRLISNAFPPYNRNAVLFPRKINGKYALLHRPSDNGMTPYGEIFYSQSFDLNYWGNHRFVMGPRPGWDCVKVGAGPVPIETSEGWLLIYHGVINGMNGFNYSMGAALLDIEKPWKVLYRAAPYIMCPRESFEYMGDSEKTVFPCAAVCDAPTGRLAIYYGAADTVMAMAFTYVDELIDFIKANSEV